ncbi:hypothetical protein ACS0TY_013239 [Phlomoides rotata]
MDPSEEEALPPTPSEVKNVIRVPMARPGFGTKGNKVPILTNHVEVKLCHIKDTYFFRYSVALFYEDGHPVDGKGIGRKVLDRVRETYKAVLGGKDFAYDGEKALFTVGPLPTVKLDFIVVLEDIASSRSHGNAGEQGSSYQSRTYKVEIRYAARIPMNAIIDALRGQESDYSQEALCVLDMILRQHSAKRGCLLVRQSFFNDDPRNFADLGSQVLACRGYHSSFRTTQGGLSLNIDVSTTVIIKPGPVAFFLTANQRVGHLSSVDWAKAKCVLKNLRVEIMNREFKITGLSEKTCREQTFTLKQRSKEQDGEEAQTTEVTVYDYFVNQRNISLTYSADLPCINVGKPKRPTYFPIELCSLVSLQRYTKALSTSQRAFLVDKSRQNPQETMSVLSNALKINKYDAEPLLHSCGVSINGNFTQVEGRVLPSPKLKVGNEEDLYAQNGRWDLKNKKVAYACEIKRWVVVSFTSVSGFSMVHNLIRIGDMKGVDIEPPFAYFNEDSLSRRASPLDRVNKMYEKITLKLSGPPDFILCLLPSRNCDIYGPWKQKTLSVGIVTQCLLPRPADTQYMTNLLLKINAKLGGLNFVLARELSLPLVSQVPTMILGMDVSHGSPGQSDIPSVAAVVSSRKWPSISRYRACIRTQSPKVEMIDGLFKPVSDTEDDDGIIRELLLDFYTSSGKRKPDQIIIFRDGVGESQFNQVLNIELTQIIEACKFLDYNWSPRFAVIVAQKNHHTKFFQPNSHVNVQPGTIIDNDVCHPKNNDFYLCAHAGMIGTTRPTHYHVLLDDIGFSPDELQELVHSLSYVYQRSTTAISVVAPIRYAHLAAAQLGQCMKFKDASETSIPKLHSRVRETMFFC